MRLYSAHCIQPDVQVSQDTANIALDCRMLHDKVGGDARIAQHLSVWLTILIRGEITGGGGKCLNVTLLHRGSEKDEARCE